MAQIYLFADGSCGTGGKDVGAWASMLATPSERKLLFGASYPTTISRMELTPIIEGLVWIRKNWGKFIRSLSVKVYSDSEYTVKTLSGLYTPGKNLDLWAALDEAINGFNMEYVWYARNQLDYMTLCDDIAGKVRRGVIDMSNSLFTDYKEPEKVIPVTEVCFE